MGVLAVGRGVARKCDLMKKRQAPSWRASRHSNRFFPHDRLDTRLHDVRQVA